MRGKLSLGYRNLRRLTQTACPVIATLASSHALATET